MRAFANVIQKREGECAKMWPQTSSMLELQIGSVMGMGGVTAGVELCPLKRDVLKP